MSSPKERRSNIAGALFFAAWTAVNIVVGTKLFSLNPIVALLLLPSYLHEAVIAASFLIRRPLLIEAEGLGARVSAYGATFLIPTFCLIVGRIDPSLLRQGNNTIFLTGMALWLGGAYIGLWSLLRLRHAFSVVPQARALVTAGPYRLCRHPVYASYVLQYGGLLLGHFSLPFACAYVVWAGLMRWRIGYEERTLAAAFPEYAAYKERVGMFFPKIAPARRPAEGAPAAALRAAAASPSSGAPHKAHSHSASV